MHDLIRKPMTVALAAVLLFCTVAPVPTGAAMFDRARANQAYANPIAGTAAEMALLAFQTACVAGGIYIAGTTLSELNINSQEIYDAFTDYYTEQNNISQSELEAILAGSYTNGNIDLSALTAAGITGAIPGFASVLMNGGLATGSETSVYQASSQITYNGYSVSFDSGVLTTRNGQQRHLFHFEGTGTDINGRQRDYYGVLDAGNPVTTYFAIKGGKIAVSNMNLYDPNGDSCGYARSLFSSYSLGNDYFDLTQMSNDYRITIASDYDFQIKLGSSTVATISNGQVTAIDNNVGVSSAVYAATVASGVTDGTYAGVNQGVVQAFNPTAEQLQAGYDASILQGVEQAVADLGTISTGIAALDATMNGLLGVCQGIASTLSNTVVGQYCAAVTQWLGATPFGTVMGTVIDGLDDIPDAVADGAAVVAGGVAALPGALEGVIEGVLEGVLGQPLAIPGFLQDILAGVQAIPGALEGAIEGITFPEWRWPEAPEIPRVNGEPVPFALSGDLIADMQADLRDKVPFCYLIRLGESFGIMFSNFQTSRSFYFDLDVPNAGSVHFDGESFLNQPLLGSNVADVIRICVTALLCTGLLYGAYKVAREL